MLRRFKINAIPILLFLAITWLFTLTTHFSPNSTEIFGHDAGIFAYIGYAITQGRPLYTGAWDNKGPVLYFINALGVIINYRYGIFILEFIAIFTSLFFMYKTACLFAPKYVSAISAILAIMPLSITLEGGNLSEEWALPFTAVAFYFIAKFLCNQFKLKRYEMMIVGACIAAIVLLRLNIITFIAVAVLGIIVILIKQKQIITLLTIALYSLIGFFIFVLPFTVYLIVNNSLLACLESAYFGALGAFSPLTTMQSISNVTQMIFDFIPSGGFFTIILFVLIFPFYLYKHKGQNSALKQLLTICYFGLFATLFANALSGAYNPHYFMCFIPIMLLPTVWFLKSVYDFVCTVKADNFVSTAVVAALAFFVCMGSLSVVRSQIFKIQQDGTNAYLNSAQIKMGTFITENSSPDDTVLILGEYVSASSYYRAKRLSASNYFYYANGRFGDESKNVFANEILKDTIENHPKIIIFETSNKLEDFVAHLENPDSYYKFIKDNYTSVETDFAHTTYIHK